MGGRGKVLDFVAELNHEGTRIISEQKQQWNHHTPSNTKANREKNKRDYEFSAGYCAHPESRRSEETRVLREIASAPVRDQQKL